MELLVVIHSTGASLRPADALAQELATVYDRAMGQASVRHTLTQPGACVILLEWPARKLGWKNWHQADPDTLAVAGLPLVEAPVGKPSKPLSPPRLTQMIRDEPSALAGVGGYFVGALATGSDELLLATDLFGMVPLYRAARGDVTVWSNKSAAAAMLAGLELRLDMQAAVQFIMLASPVGDRSLLEGVQLEPPATVIHVRGKHMARVPYMRAPVDYFQHRLPAVQAIAGAIAGMTPLAHIMRTGPDEACVHLSGGQDSRAVAALLRHHNYQPTCITHGTPNPEVPSAQRLARALDMTYRTVPGQTADASVFRNFAAPSLWQSDGLMSLKYLAGMYDLDYVHTHNYLPIEGYGGELGRGYYIGSDDAWQKIRAGDLTPMLDRMLAARTKLWPDPRVTDPVRDVVAQVLQDSQRAGLDGPQTATWYYAYQRARRWASARRNTGWQRVFDPLMLPCWVLPAMSADPQDQRGDQLIRALAHAAWPAVQHVPTLPELNLQARRRRVASNRIVRGALRVYDALRGPPPEAWGTQNLRTLRPHLIEEIRAAHAWLAPLVTAEIADAWLATPTWTYDQTEMFWHAATVAMWSREILGKPAPLRPCIATSQSGPS